MHEPLRRSLHPPVRHRLCPSPWPVGFSPHRGAERHPGLRLAEDRAGGRPPTAWGGGHTASGPPRTLLCCPQDGTTAGQTCWVDEAQRTGGFQSRSRHAAGGRRRGARSAGETPPPRGRRWGARGVPCCVGGCSPLHGVFPPMCLTCSHFPTLRFRPAMFPHADPRVTQTPISS